MVSTSAYPIWYLIRLPRAIAWARTEKSLRDQRRVSSMIRGGRERRCFDWGYLTCLCRLCVVYVLSSDGGAMTLYPVRLG